MIATMLMEALELFRQLPAAIKVNSGEFVVFPASIRRDCDVLFVCVVDAETALYTELWRACAGPLVNVPRERELVYYFPQGHIEQVIFIIFTCLI